jgi:hypothetical protein
MPYFDETSAAMPMLQSTLQYVALPAEQQIAEIADGQCVPCEVCRKFSVWHKWHAPAVLETDLTDLQRNALQRLSELATEANDGGECYETERVRTGEGFFNLRAGARQALEVFGWTPGLPDRSFLAGTREFSERMDAGRQRRLQAQKSACLPGPARLVYHSDVCELLGIEVAVSEQNLQILKRREAELGFSLPASVKELLSIQGMYTEFYNATARSSLTGWDGDEWNSLERVGNSSDIQEGYLHVAGGGDGVGAWYVRLDEGADPPVYYNDDSCAETLAEIPWRIAAGSFSAFAFEGVAWFRFSNYKNEFEVETVDGPIPDSALVENLSQRFRRGPNTARPELQSWTFFTPTSVILVIAGLYSTVESGKCFWKISAADSESMYEAIEPVWRYRNLAESFGNLQQKSDEHPSFKRILERLDRS